jgi:hypothetical protein
LEEAISFTNTDHKTTKSIQNPQISTTKTLQISTKKKDPHKKKGKKRRRPLLITETHHKNNERSSKKASKIMAKKKDTIKNLCCLHERRLVRCGRLPLSLGF